jgi:DNA polymerase-4
MATHNQNNAQTIWSRAIILIDMNAFFAGVEQLDNPEWRGRPICVTNGEQGTCIITCSYEARAYGIKTGMRLRDARRLCPDLLQAPSHPHRYAEVSRTIMQALLDITPDREIFSVDECFLDVTRCQQLYGTPEHIGWMVKQKVFEASGGLLCSVGVSGDKTTAKFAAKQFKPNGFMVIPPWQAQERLKNVPVTELCGIGTGIGKFLAKYGAHNCGDVAQLPIGLLAKRFGNLGRRIWYMCQGADPDPLHMHIAAPKSMGHGKVMPPNTQDMDVITTYLRHMSEKLAARLRRHDLQAQHFFIGIRSYDWGWFGGKVQTIQPTHDGKLIFELGRQIILNTWTHAPVGQIQVTALDPQIANLQYDLFLTADERRVALHAAIDKINARYGEFAIAPAPLLHRSSMHNVIAPAWKPEGHRQTI